MNVINFATDVLLKTLPLLAVIALALAIERWRPVEPPSLRALRLNLPYTFIYAFAYAVLQTGTAVLTVAAVNAAGGGLIVLSKDGWALLPSFLAYMLTLDGLEYLFHRAQHRWHWLWRMHSLHHSDPSMNASTTQRHFWLEPGIKMLTIYLLVGLLFKTPGTILGMYALLGLYHIFPHMNLRVGFGRGWFLMNSPQYHRIHHSARPEHYNCNFAALFPVFDVLGKTYKVPQPEEFPPTGLGPDETPSGLADAVIWPWRKVE